MRAPVSLAAALVLLGACGSDATAPEPSETTPSRAGDASDRPERDSRKCLARQADAIYVIRFPLQDLTERLLADPERQPVATWERFQRRLDAVALRKAGVCDGEALSMAPLVEATRETRGRAPDKAALRRIVDEFQAWGRRLGRPRDARIVWTADICAEMREHVTVTYGIRSRTEDGGLRAQVELRMVNDWFQEMYLQHGGEVVARGVQPDGATVTYRWGGSSSDSMGAAPGRTSTGAADLVPAPPEGVHLLPWGDAQVLEVGGYAYGEGVRPCSIDVVDHGRR